MPERIARAVAVVAALGASPDLLEACTPAPVVSVSGDDTAPVDLSISEACAYSRLSLEYGPFSIVEEASVHGQLDVALPRLPRVENLSVRWSEGSLSLPVPAAAEGYGLVAVRVSDTVRLTSPSGGLVRQVGFPMPDAAPLAFATLAPGAAAELLFDVTAETCGRTVSVEVFRSGVVRAETVEVAMPSCDVRAAAVRVPLVR